MDSADASKTATDSTGAAESEAPGHDAEAEEDERIDPRELQREIEERYEEIEGRYDEIRGMLEAYNDQARDVILDHPVACVTGAVGVGYLVGRLAARRWLV